MRYEKSNFSKLDLKIWRLKKTLPMLPFKVSTFINPGRREMKLERKRLKREGLYNKKDFERDWRTV
jgi:hypothetical protein